MEKVSLLPFTQLLHRDFFSLGKQKVQMLKALTHPVGCFFYIQSIPFSQLKIVVNLQDQMKNDEVIGNSGSQRTCPWKGEGQTLVKESVRFGNS